MKTTVPQCLTQGLVTLLVVAASLTAYDRWVLRPALVIGVVDVAEVYRAKEAEFTQILTKALSQPASEEERQKALVMARAFAQRLPLALDEPASSRRTSISREDLLAAALTLIGPHRSLSTLSLREVAREDV